jgi:hypothetical protein
VPVQRDPVPDRAGMPERVLPGVGCLQPWRTGRPRPVAPAVAGAPALAGSRPSSDREPAG